MATASDNTSYTLAACLSAAIVLTGCGSVIPVKPQAVLPKPETSAPQARRHAATVPPTPAAVLPRQAYSSNGEKVAYVAQPNPYTARPGSVPEEARSIFVVASARLEKGDLEAAQAKYTLLTEKYPGLSGPWLKLGIIAEQQEQYPAAVANYEKAISVNRDNVNAYVALGLLQRRQGNFDAARQAYLDALAVWRDFPEAHLNLAILYDLYMNRADEAQKHYEAYHFLTGERDEQAHKWLVEVRHRTGIEQSFIDIPPADGVAATDTGSESAVAVARSKAAD